MVVSVKRSVMQAPCRIRVRRNTPLQAINWEEMDGLQQPGFLSRKVAAMHRNIGHFQKHAVDRFLGGRACPHRLGPIRRHGAHGVARRGTLRWSRRDR